MAVMKKVVVTGGAGFIGAHIVEALVARGDEVHVIDNYAAGKREDRFNASAVYHEVDIRDYEKVAPDRTPARDIRGQCHGKRACPTGSTQSGREGGEGYLRELRLRLWRSGYDAARREHDAAAKEPIWPAKIDDGADVPAVEHGLRT